MDSTQLMLSLLFGLVGMGMFMYGKNAGRMVPLLTGVGLMGIPCIIPNPIALLCVCSGLMTLPWLLRNQ